MLAFVMFNQLRGVIVIVILIGISELSAGAKKNYPGWFNEV